MNISKDEEGIRVIMDEMGYSYDDVIKMNLPYYWWVLKEITKSEGEPDMPVKTRKVVSQLEAPDTEDDTDE